MPYWKSGHEKPIRDSLSPQAREMFYTLDHLPFKVPPRIESVKPCHLPDDVAQMLTRSSSSTPPFRGYAQSGGVVSQYWAGGNFSGTSYYLPEKHQLYLVAHKEQKLFGFIGIDVLGKTPYLWLPAPVMSCDNGLIDEHRDTKAGWQKASWLVARELKRRAAFIGFGNVVRDDVLADLEQTSFYSQAMVQCHLAAQKIAEKVTEPLARVAKSLPRLSGRPLPFHYVLLENWGLVQSPLYQWVRNPNVFWNVAMPEYLTRLEMTEIEEVAEDMDSYEILQGVYRHEC